MKKNPEISIVIPAYNEEKYLPRTLESIANLSTNRSFEVILVDNNSKDKTAQIAKKFKNKFNIRVINEKKVGRGAARARGFKEAKGKIILSTDADTQVYPAWLDTLVEPIDSGAQAATLYCRVDDIPRIRRVILNSVTPVGMVLYRVIFGHYWLSGFSFAIRKEIYEKSGGFNPDLQSQEDLDLAFRVARVGKIKFIKRRPVTFSGRRFKKGLMLGLMDYFKGFTRAFLLKKNPYLDNPR